MFELIFKGYKDTKAYDLINKFYESPLYIFIVALIALASNIFGLEGSALIFYIFFSALIPFLFTNNMNPVIAPVFMGYITVSKVNNYVDVYNPSQTRSLLSVPGFVPVCIISGIVLGSLVLIRILVNIFVIKKKYTFPKFLISILIFLVASAIGGILTPYYASNTLIFGLMVGLFMLVPYIGLYFVVDFKKIKDDNFAFILLAFALVLIAEEIYIYLPHIHDITSIDVAKEVCRTGWGIGNNIGGELAIALAGPAYLAIKHKGGVFYLVTLLLTYLAIVGTFSRDSIIFGALILLICLIVILIKGNGKRRIETLLTLLVFGGIMTGLYFWKKDRIDPLFEQFITSLTTGNLDVIAGKRGEIYNYGINQFLENPIFGVGYFKLDIFESPYLSTGIVPSRYHNTFVQLLASTGSIGLLAYLYHRFVTLKVTLKGFNTEKAFIFISILGLLLTSLLDCHLFNLGPTMEYSTLLLLLEGVSIKNKELKKL